MWLNPQTWAVISGHASKEQAEIAMESVERELNTAYGAKVMAPSYVDHYFDGCIGWFVPTINQREWWYFLSDTGLVDLGRSFDGTW